MRKEGEKEGRWRQCLEKNQETILECQVLVQRCLNVERVKESKEHRVQIS